MAEDYEDVFDDLVDELGGVAVAWAQPRNTTTNTKSIGAADCYRSDQAQGEGEGLGQDTCAFNVRASAFTSGFSAENPVTPKVGDSVTPAGETAWTVRAVTRRGRGAYYRADATRDRPGWDS